MWVNGKPIRMNGTTLTLDEHQIAVDINTAVESYYEGVEGD